MITAWTEDAWQDYLEQNENVKVLEAINALIKDIKRDPFKGLGTPEPLKHALQGWWSRRITGEHRLVIASPARARRNSSILFNVDITIERTSDRRKNANASAVIARSACDEAIQLSLCRAMDCFAVARNDVGAARLAL